VGFFLFFQIIFSSLNKKLLEAYFLSSFIFARIFGYFLQPLLGGTKSFIQDVPLS